MEALAKGLDVEDKFIAQLYQSFPNPQPETERGWAAARGGAGGFWRPRARRAPGGKKSGRRSDITWYYIGHIVGCIFSCNTSIYVSIYIYLQCTFSGPTEPRKEGLLLTLTVGSQYDSRPKPGSFKLKPQSPGLRAGLITCIRLPQRPEQNKGLGFRV